MEIVKMKFNLNITDMNEEEFAKLFANINVPCKTEVAVVPEEPVVSNSDIVPSEETVNYDVDGLQWDARIHSSNHKINSDGRWQRRRGISDEEFNRVKNELLGVQEPVAEVAPVVAPAPVAEVAPVAPAVTLSPELAAVNHTLYSTPEELAKVTPYAPTPVAPVAPVAPTPIAPAPVAPVAPVAPEPTPVIDTAVLYQTMFEKIKVGMSNQKVGPNDIKTLVEAVNAQFGLQYTTLAQVKDNIPALQFVINDLTARGL